MLFIELWLEFITGTYMNIIQTFLLDFKCLNWFGEKLVLSYRLAELSFD